MSRQIANYIVDDQPLAQGGMGRIYRGTDPQGRVVAVKEILPEFATDWAIISRIEQEAKFLAGLDNPSIVNLYAAFPDPQTGCYYIVMELVEGMNIEQYVIKNGAIPEEKAVEIMLKILDALKVVHNAHIVHRDIKPSNIMLRPDGSVCMLDFGIARDMEHGGGTVTGSVLGTSGYMSPEQANGYSISYTSDIYALGCVFFYMLTGHHAFNTLATEFETRDAIINMPFPKLSKYKSEKDLPDMEPLQRILDKATDKNMMQRYQSCYEFYSALSNGTQVSLSKGSGVPVKVSVGREKCDIIVNDAAHKISRHHADIELKEFTGGKYYVFTDCSSNGSVVNRKVVKGSSVSFPVGGPAPEIYLAGVVEGWLDWQLVTKKLAERARALEEEERVVVNSGGNGGNGSYEREKPQPHSVSGISLDCKDEDATGWLIAAYIFALLGGLLGVILGAVVATAKIEVMEKEEDSYKYRKIYKYKKSHRQMGWGAAGLAVVSMIIWMFIV